MKSTINTTEKKLIQAGIRLAKVYGLKFSVRQLCDKSKVNLGLFHYYFKNKENFDKQLLAAVYQQMLADITPRISPDMTPRENIKTILLALHRFASSHRMFLSSLLGDVLSGDKQMLHFLTKNFTQHAALLLHELHRADIRPALKNQPLPALMASLALPVIFPQIFMGLLERVGPSFVSFNTTPLKQIVRDEKQLDIRIEHGLNTIFGEKK